MVVRFTTTYAICAYHHWCEFESQSGRCVQRLSVACDSCRKVYSFYCIADNPIKYRPIRMLVSVSFINCQKMAVQDGRHSALDKKDNTEWFGHKFYGKVGICYSIYRLEETSQVNTRIALQIILPDMWNLADLAIFSRKYGLFYFWTYWVQISFFSKEKIFSFKSITFIRMKFLVFFFYSVKQDIPKFSLLPISYPCWYMKKLIWPLCTEWVSKIICIYILSPCKMDWFFFQMEAFKKKVSCFRDDIAENKHRSIICDTEKLLS